VAGGACQAQDQGGLGSPRAGEGEGGAWASPRKEAIFAPARCATPPAPPGTNFGRLGIGLYRLKLGN